MDSAKRCFVQGEEEVQIATEIILITSRVLRLKYIESFAYIENEHEANNNVKNY